MATRTIKAGALDRDKHVGLLASHQGAPNPREIVRVAHLLTHVLVLWGDRTTTAVSLNAEITLHDGGGGGGG